MQDSVDSDMQKNGMQFKLIQQTTLHQGFFRFDAWRLRHSRFDGGDMEIVRENMERGDAVAVLLYDPARDEVLLIEQFRIGAAIRCDNNQQDAWLLEIVAGMIDEGESPEQCARRECVEEAGYTPQTLQSLGWFFSSPGGCSERLFLYLAEVDAAQPSTAGGGVAEENEDIRSQWVSRQQALDWVANGRINSAAPMLALLLAFREHPAS